MNQNSSLREDPKFVSWMLTGNRADLGWQFIEDLRANQASAVRGNGAVLRAVATGEKAYGIIVDFMAFNAKKQGSPVNFVFPKEGVTVVTEPVAILKTSQNKSAARQFVDYLLSDCSPSASMRQIWGLHGGRNSGSS
jgi:ABC-type Fe3+ transport system substrate-binding protein